MEKTVAAATATAAWGNSTSPQNQALLLMLIIDCIILYTSLLHLTKSVFNIALSLQIMFWGHFQCQKLHHELTPVQSSRTPAGNFAHTPLPESSNVHERDHDKEGISINELRMVMGRLGINWYHDDHNGDKQLQNEKVRANDITAMFEELEPSLEEAKEAFDVFDANGDGFIDPQELTTVISRLCCLQSQTSEANCKEMIRAYDENGDGLVDFNEFLKLLWNSFNGGNVTLF